MYTLHVFRTETKDHNEAFSKMEEYIKNHNKDFGLSLPKEAGEKIKKVILSVIDDYENDDPFDLEIFKKLNQYPFKGDTILDFGKYLSKFIKNNDGVYCTSLGHLRDELYELDFDEEGSKIEHIIDSVQFEVEDSYYEFCRGIYVRIYGCIRFDDKIYNYKDNSLKEDEWSISVLKKSFIDDDKIVDIFNDEDFDGWWDVQALHNLDNDLPHSESNENEESSNKKTFFVITYIKEDEEYPLEDCDE